MTVIIIVTGESSKEFAEILFKKCIYNGQEKNWYSVIKINADNNICNNAEYFLNSYDVILIYMIDSNTNNNFQDYVKYYEKNKIDKDVLLITYSVYKFNYCISDNLNIDHILCINDTNNVEIYSKLTANDVHCFLRDFKPKYKHKLAQNSANNSVNNLAKFSEYDYNYDFDYNYEYEYDYD